MAKLNDLRALAEYTAKDVSGSPQDWMGYLDTASRLYRYPFSDNLLIHAQRPDAAACASLELWNQKMNRWVNRGAKGIALIDDTGPRLRLRYVFDLTDTHMVRGGRTPNLWQIQEQQREDVLDHLIDTYGLEGNDAADLQSALLVVASQMADENLEEAMEGLEYELKGTFLEELNEDAVRVDFRNLLMNSAFYTFSRRCGLDPMEYLEEEDFTAITDFNTLSVLAFLQGGGAYSDGRLTTYAFFIQEKTDKERTDFIKSQYGIVGRSHALSGADNSYADYNGKGLKLKRGSIGNPDIEVLLKWPKVAKRVEYLIENGNFLKAADFSRMPVYERERMAGRVVNFYYHLPEDIAPPWGENVDMFGWQKDVVRLLESPEETESLLKQMDEAIAKLPLDFEDYEGKVQILTDLHQYVEGTYTIFPERKKEVEIQTTGNQQLSLFDFMDAEIPETAIENQDVETAEKKTPDISEAMDKAGTYFDQFSPEQMDVIYEAAQKKLDLVPMLKPEFSPEQMQLIADVMVQVAANKEAMFGHELDPLINHVMSVEEINDVRKNRQFALEPLGDDVQEPQEQQNVGQDTKLQEHPETASTEPERINFHITDDDLGAGGPKQKFRANMEAVRLLHELEFENRMATPEEQEVLSRYVGWGGLSQAFEEKSENWSEEFIELYTELSQEEYQAARASTLNAFYTSPTVIKAMYEALENMGLQSGNVLEPSCGIGNFMGMVPPDMEKIKMYGVELDSISGRIARQLYQKNEIAVQGFEKTEYPDSFFDCVIGNVPFGAYKVAVVTSSGTMDKQNLSVRQYIVNRADLLGAIRLPNNAFQRNANTGVVADILFFQKRDRATLTQPDWVSLGKTPEGHKVNTYFAERPEMVLGEFSTESTQYGKQEVTVKPIEDAVLSEQLKKAVSHIEGTITEVELEDSELDEIATSIPADPTVKNFSFANVDGQVYYRENSKMNRMELPAMTTERVLGMIGLRNLTQELLQCQLEDASDGQVAFLQERLNRQYDSFTARYGLISRGCDFC